PVILQQLSFPGLSVGSCRTMRYSVYSRPIFFPFPRRSRTPFQTPMQRTRMPFSPCFPLRVSLYIPCCTLPFWKRFLYCLNCSKSILLLDKFAQVCQY